MIVNRKQSKTMLVQLLNPICYLTIFCLPFCLVAQCPTQDLIFTTQDQIDQFAIDYPDCTELDVKLVIDGGIGSDIENLAAFSKLEIIKDELKFVGDFSSDLNNLVELKNLKEVDRFNLSVTNLRSIDEEVNFRIMERLFLSFAREINSLGQIKLNEIMEEVIFSNVNSLEGDDYNLILDLQGVNNLEFTESNIRSLGMQHDIEIYQTFKVNDCQYLESISGLKFDTEMGILRIYECPVLSSPINNLDNIERITLFTFHGNDFITDLPSLSSLRSVETIRMVDLSDLENLLALENVIIEDLIEFGNLPITNLDGIHFNPDSYPHRISLNLLPNITNLSGLPPLDSIKYLEVSVCNNFKSFEGIESVTFIEDLYLGFLSDLENFESLPPCEIRRNLIIFNCAIKNLDGLELTEKIQEAIVLEGNNSLENIDGLSNLKILGEVGGFNTPALKIINNGSLISLQPLVQTLVDLEVLEIRNNPLLSICSVPPICQALSNIDTQVIIEDNMTGCNTVDEILEDCRSNQVLVFHDLDENNEKDQGEYDLPIGRINVNDAYEILPNNTNGNFSFYDAGENAFMEYIPEDNWEITGPSSIYTLDSGTTNNFEIGIIPTAEVHDVEVSLAFDRIICDQTYVLTAIVKNVGTTSKDVQLVIEGHGILNSATQEFEFNNMLPGEFQNVTIVYTAADVSQVTPGDPIELKATISYEDETGSIIEKVTSYETIFLCAYDPNDKQVFPAGVQDENYTLFEDNILEYKIRFQNTGNFPAEDIVIRDSLSESLDLSTLKFIHASHPISEIRLDRNVVEFRFDDIFLIDSLTNEPESHGYLQFSIETMEDLDENTVINNTAHIYFDANPAIVTNTVFNTFVSEIPITSNENLEEQRFKLMPNPSRSLLNIEMVNTYGGGQWKIFNQLGREIISGKSFENNFDVNIKTLENGLYFFQLNGTSRRFIKID